MKNSIHFSTHVRVRYSETDQMGIVHHSNYIHYLEVARIEFLDAIGIPYKDLESQGYRLPVIGLNIDYKRPAYFDDEIRIALTIARSPSIKMQIDYQLFSRDNLLVSAWTKHAFVNPQGMPIKPPVVFWDNVAKALLD